MAKSRPKVLKLMLAIIPVLIAAAVFIVARGQREPAATTTAPAEETRPGPGETLLPGATSGSTGSEVKILDASQVDEMYRETQERLEEQRRARLKKAIKELNAKLYVEDPSDGGGSTDRRTRLRLRVSLEERVRLIEEFLKEFPLSWETYSVAMNLAEIYRHTGRYVDAERVYSGIVLSLPDHSFAQKQDTLQEIAKMQLEAGNLDAAEKTLLEIMNTEAPYAYEPDDDRMEVNIKIKAPLLLAAVYGKAGRAEDAEGVLKQVDEYMFSLPQNYGEYGNVPYYSVHVCSMRIAFLFGRTPVEKFDEAMKSAETLIQDYERKLAGRTWTSPEHIQNYILDYVDHLHLHAADTACRLRIESIFANTAAGDVESSLKATESIIEEYRKNLEAINWNHPEKIGRESSRSPDHMREYAERLAAAKKRTAEGR